MTTRRFLSGSLVGVLALSAAACDMDKLTAVNENPNNPTDAPATAVFVNATRNAVSRWLGNANVRQFELVAQHFAEVQYPETDAYVRLTSGFTSGNFNTAYFTEQKDFQQVVRKGREQSAPGIYAPALVMRTWGYGILTDLHGDIPYSGALMGDSLQLDGRIQPAYDPQQAIYNDLFATLAEASSALNSAAGVSLGAADRIYAGNRPAWQRFSNSLRARHALRIVNVDPAKASAELALAFAAPGGVFTSNAQSARFNWPGGGVYDNPIAINFQTRDDHRVSTRLMTYLKGWSDPRLPVYAQPASETGEYTGLANALSHLQAVAQVGTTSRPSLQLYPTAASYASFPGATGTTAPSYLMTYAELLFIRAEAAERSMGGLTPAQAAGFYNAAIRASMDQWGVTSTAAIDTYLARTEVAYQGSTEGLKQIAIQKWLALYGDGVQAWSEFRRTCQPAILAPGPSATLNQIPRRLQYSATEAAVNSENMNAAIARQGPDLLTTRIWWDKAPQAAPTFQAGCGVRGSAGS